MTQLVFQSAAFCAAVLQSASSLHVFVLLFSQMLFSQRAALLGTLLLCYVLLNCSLTQSIILLLLLIRLQYTQVLDDAEGSSFQTESVNVNDLIQDKNLRFV
mgnify:CR=1 FL=1